MEVVCVGRVGRVSVGTRNAVRSLLALGSTCARVAGGKLRPSNHAWPSNWTIKRPRGPIWIAPNIFQALFNQGAGWPWRKWISKRGRRSVHVTWIACVNARLRVLPIADEEQTPSVQGGQSIQESLIDTARSIARLLRAVVEPVRVANCTPGSRATRSQHVRGAEEVKFAHGPISMRPKTRLAQRVAESREPRLAKPKEGASNGSFRRGRATAGPRP